MNPHTQHDRSGLTLVELLLSMTIFAILAVGLRQAVSAACSSFIAGRNQQEMLANGRFAMEQIVSFVQESDAISVPASNRLVVSERRLDTYNNRTRVFAADGDGILDADNNYNGRLNDNSSVDWQESVTFSLDTARNALLETLPDYSLQYPWSSSGSEGIICEYVKSFACTLLNTNLVQIELILDDGQGTIVLQTRAKARLVQAVQ